MSKKAPTNTAETAGEDGLIMLVMGMALGPSAAIEHQERMGQHELANSDTLPAKVSPEGLKALEAAGVVFGEMVPRNSLFRYVTLPEGWKIVPTDRSIWSHLVDNKGRQRAAIGYKAAFYDRWANMAVLTRFSATVDYSDDATRTGMVTDGGEKIIYRTKTQDATGPDRYEMSDKLQEAAQAWLNEHRPRWRELTAYWDED